MNLRGIAAGLMVAGLASCTQMRPEPTAPSGHLEATAQPSRDIPEVVSQAPFVPAPEPVPASERYTVVVNDVPVRELLFALARDAELNIDIGGAVEGKVTINAIDQTLPQILERIARQVDLRYELIGETYVISTDEPYLRTYEVDYLNLSREVDTTVTVETRVATTGGGSVDDSGGGGGANRSSTRVHSQSYNRFWETLYNNVLAILGETESSGGSEVSYKVIMNAEAGLMSVKATSLQHRFIEEYVDKVLVNARRQVLVEATIVEVVLNDQYQAGVDWDFFLNEEAGFDISQSLLGAVTDGVIDNAISATRVTYFDPTVGNNAVQATVRLLREFGDTKVLSSPRLMVLNNQTAVLKVVEELVYFTIEVTDKDSTATSQGRTLVESEVHSVPVGLVMSVTPQISSNGEIILTVRPTISEKIGDAIDPGPQLAAEASGATDPTVTNLVPIIRVREMESVLKLVDGQIAVLGGLMQDIVKTGVREVPGLAKIPFIGELIFDADEFTMTKSELVIFLRPVIVRDPSVNTDLNAYREYLKGGATP
ncbi:MAG: secretin N-terminal domain-containing protein [Gammaproteobacteria bacterium]|nr:secretin N-terminal domain-containing protein [Gammaproteobacteria bacterium]